MSQDFILNANCLIKLHKSNMLINYSKKRLQESIYVYQLTVYWFTSRSRSSIRVGKLKQRGDHFYASPAFCRVGFGWSLLCREILYKIRNIVVHQWWPTGTNLSKTITVDQWWTRRWGTTGTIGYPTNLATLPKYVG